jgi:hypothetical protein
MLWPKETPLGTMGVVACSIELQLDGEQIFDI